MKTQRTSTKNARFLLFGPSVGLFLSLVSNKGRLFAKKKQVFVSKRALLKNKC